ncbi:hypothetical protein JCM9534A_50350 [Catenuloplanes indicus JCM 9534]|uniref:Fe2+ or Zn2+ uptake regulation protein n=1 Tax=Catenuloplanes indicus TaxID=137267 RepID=A0AAE3W1W6_9ACTN|nr:Fe2+ or Zn2+ uptake regulation protein [Catenuloplanes indicus]
MPTADEQLRTHGLRVTRPRLAVLDVLATGGHLEVEEIARQVRLRLDSVSTQAIYDVLGALSRAGLARRLEPAGSPARYEARTGDNHHHVVCRGCGRSPTSTAWSVRHRAWTRTTPPASRSTRPRSRSGASAPPASPAAPPSDNPPTPPPRD